VQNPEKFQVGGGMEPGEKGKKKRGFGQGVVPQVKKRPTTGTDRNAIEAGREKLQVRRN